MTTTPDYSKGRTYWSKLSEERLERVQTNDGLLTYPVETLPDAGDFAEVVSSDGVPYPGEVVYATPANTRCEYGCLHRWQHVHVSIS